MSMSLSKILYVEDEPSIQRLVQVALQQLGGYEVVLCSDGSEAVGLIEVDPPDFVLLDVMMPGLDGPNTLAAIRASELGGNLPIAFITAKAQPDEIQRLLDLGAVGVIVKPFNPMTLSSEVEALWQKFKQG